jgi:hypothetical protein
MTISLILNEKDLRRFNEKWKISDTLFYNGTPCHMWTAFKAKGYGKFGLCGTTRRAHRISYAIYHNTNDFSEIDHLCRNPSCINPLHLEAVNRRKNVVRSRRGKLHPNKTSKYVGVHKDSESSKWVWSLSFNGKVINGRCNTEIEAHNTYQRLVKRIEETGDIGEIPRKVYGPNKGCYFIKKTGRWKAVYRDKHLGVFATIEEARQAYANAELS